MPPTQPFLARTNQGETNGFLTDPSTGNTWALGGGGNGYEQWVDLFRCVSLSSFYFFLRPKATRRDGRLVRLDFKGQTQGTNKWLPSLLILYPQRSGRRSGQGHRPPGKAQRRQGAKAHGPMAPRGNAGRTFPQIHVSHGESYQGSGQNCGSLGFCGNFRESCNLPVIISI